MDLEGLELDENTKRFISSIVDNYVYGKKYLVDGTNPYILAPGIQFQNIFTDWSGKNIFNVNLNKDSDSNIEVYFVYRQEFIKANDDEDDDDAEERFLKIKKAEFIYKVFLLKSFLEDGYILLVDDNDSNLFYTGKITKKDTERWKENGIKFHREIIKSRVLFDFISQFYGSTIIPSPQLINYKNNNFKTPDQKRFRLNSLIALTAIFVSFVIGFASPWLMTKFSKTTIDENQLEKVLKAMPKQAEEIRLNQAQMDSILNILENTRILDNDKTQNAKP